MSARGHAEAWRQHFLDPTRGFLGQAAPQRGKRNLVPPKVPAASNDRAKQLLGCDPPVFWCDAIRPQTADRLRDPVKGLPMARSVPTPLRKVSA